MIVAFIWKWTFCWWRCAKPFRRLCWWRGRGRGHGGELVCRRARDAKDGSGKRRVRRWRRVFNTARCNAKVWWRRWRRVVLWRRSRQDATTEPAWARDARQDAKTANTATAPEPWTFARQNATQAHAEPQETEIEPCLTSVVGPMLRAVNDEHLAKLRGWLKPMAKEAKRSAARRRGRVFAGNGAPKLPRAICPVCSKPHDFAIQTKPGIPEVRTCSDCKAQLAAGLTALVGKPKISGEWLHAWVVGAPFKPGEVITGLSEETMQAVKAKFDERSKKADDHP